MDSRVALVLCLVTVLSQTHGYPRSSEEAIQQESQEILGTAALSGEEEVRSRSKPSSGIEALKSKYKTPPQLPSVDEKISEKDGREREIVKAASTGAKLKVHFPEDSKQASEDDTDNVRSKKSPDMRDMTYNYGQHPHTTTVCIQVRSDHAPQVVCGPQVGEEKKEEKPPTAARYAPDPYRAAQGPSHYPQQMPQRMPQRPYPPRPIPGPYMRSEEEPRPAEPAFQPAYQPANGPAKGPYQVIPNQPSSPGSVVVHKQYYAPAPPLLPAPSPLRLNCAYQPESSYPYGYPYASSLYRSSPGPMGYVPVGSEQVILQEGSTRIPTSPYTMGPYPGAMTGRSAADPNSAEAGYYLDPQEIIGAPYPYSEYGYSVGIDPWTGTAHPEDAQYHQELQARAAAGDELAKQQLWELQQRGSPEDARRQYFREQELRQSQQRLQRLENQLTIMQARAAGDQEKGVKITMETNKNPTSAESSSQDTQDMKKSDQQKQTKRQTKVK